MRSMLFVIFFSISASLVAASKDADSTVQSLIDKYGGAPLTNDHAQASGTIKYADGSSKSFTLTAKKRVLRMELQSADQAMTITRNDGRTQVAKSDRTDYPNRTPRSASAINLLPIFTLLEFADDPRFSGSSVQDKDGTARLNYLEGTPSGVTAPPFPQPKLSVEFSLDSAGRISQVMYKEDGRSIRLHAYRYYYDQTVAGPFLQPGKIEHAVDGRLLWTASLDSVRKQAQIPSNYFKILETRERAK